MNNIKFQRIIFEGADGLYGVPVPYCKNKSILIYIPRRIKLPKILRFEAAIPEDPFPKLAPIKKYEELGPRLKALLLEQAPEFLNLDVDVTIYFEPQDFFDSI